MDFNDFIKGLFPNPKRKLGLIQAAVINTQLFNQIPTYCIHCKKAISFKVIRGDGSYTRLCECGCRLFQYHEPDKYHKLAFFTEKFISKKYYDEKYKYKDSLEKIGFKKRLTNGKVHYEK